MCPAGRRVFVDLVSNCTVGVMTVLVEHAVAICPSMRCELLNTHIFLITDELLCEVAGRESLRLDIARPKVRDSNRQRMQWSKRATADAQACSNPPTAPPVVQPTTSAAGAANASGGFSDPATQMQVTVSNVQRTTGYSNQPQVVFYVSITNNGSSAHDYNPLDFTCVDEGNQEHSGDSLLQSPFSDAELSYGALAPGDTRAGWVGCDMPSGSRLRVTWDDAFNLQPTEQVWP
jgi:Domain of unknown function (DUF4352)